MPADSFFEWTHNTTREKTKFEFTIRDGGLFGMAGLWSPWLNPRSGQWEQTFSILIGEANKVMWPIHDRQPKILEPRGYGEYLAPTSWPPLHLLRVLPGQVMKIQAMSGDKDEERQGLLFDGQPTPPPWQSSLPRRPKPVNHGLARMDTINVSD